MFSEAPFLADDVAYEFYGVVTSLLRIVDFVPLAGMRRAGVGRKVSSERAKLVLKTNAFSTANASLE